MPNRLAQEPSPYLRQHADNPVEWYPWGAEALERAKREDKPILLSVGYSACHWCHVMEHESFEDPDTAARMNAGFVNIKVDREERPDLDQLYQGVVQLMGRGGGWPLTVFLTPDRMPFFGGTYFPPQPRHGLPGFGSLVDRLAQAWRERRVDIDLQAKEFEQGLVFIARHGLDAEPAAVDGELVVRAAEAVLAEVDPVNGGFGGAPKFPNPMNLSLLLRGYRRTRRAAFLGAVTQALAAMARGGVYDQLGGGFHRYSVDARWEVPHFEKMLYDNAQLLHLYAEAQQVAPDPLWEKVARETVAYLAREMTSSDGGLFAAQDADSEGEEGRFFVWTPAQVDAVLPTNLAEVAKRTFGITAEGNFEHSGATVLQLKVEPAQVGEDAQEAQRLLFESREKRVKPGLDEKQLAGWNGLAIRGLAFAARAFGQPDWAVQAARAADFVLGKLWDGQTLWRAYQGGERRIEALLEDYGDLALGLTSLYQATFEPRYLEAAETLGDRAVALFWDAPAQAYLAAQKGQPDLVVPVYALHDSAHPSGASTLTEAQVALSALTGRPRHLEQAERYLRKLRAPMERSPFAFGHLLLAADTFADGAAAVALVGSRPGLRSLLEVMNRHFAPTVAVLAHEEGRTPPVVVQELLAGRGSVQGRAAAYLCRHSSCALPLTEPDALREALDASA